MRRKKAIIVGGGIGGLATAIALEEANMDVVVHERADSLRAGGTGLTLWSNATYALQKLGVLNQVYSRGKIILESEICTSKGETLSQIPLIKLAKKYGTSTVGILRSELYSILLDRIHNSEVKTSSKCIGFEQTDTQVKVYFENGETVVGDLLIGADGIHSSVRKNIYTTDHLRQSGYTAWRGVSKFCHPYCSNGYMYEAWGRGVRFGFVPVSNDTVYWFATKNSALGQTASSSCKRELLDLFRDFKEPIPSVIYATDENTIITNNIYDRSPKRTWIKGRVVLIGDAAHPMTPNLGQGACLTLEDAVVLGNCLVKEPDNISNALTRYESERINRASFVVKASWQFGKMAQVENPIVCWCRNLVIKLTPSILQQKHFDKTIGYRVY
jgi:2-polyprenyl-6-methoxyphenol hydroxylase-like FAD-dependent oxidoreductase